MGVTISTHNGSAVRREHNIRNEKVVSKEPHIDPNGIHETWIDEPTKERDRMRRYMDSLQFNDGTTALERFEEQEQQLHQKLNRDLQR